MNVAAGVSNTSVSSRKLLKMHEAKYEPMDKVDAEKIMEEILGMKAGLNPDQQVRYTIFLSGFPIHLVHKRVGEPDWDALCCNLMDASLCHIMNAAYCQIIMFYASI